MEEYLDFALDIAKYAGEEIKNNFSSTNNIIFKSDRTPVTEVDKKINHYLIEKVNEKYPDHSVIGEEEVSSNTSDYVWVCDPVDGTGMFTNSVPVCVFSLALVVDGEVQVGVVYDPFLDKMYTAIKGKGAYCNGEKLCVNNKRVGDLGYRVNYEMWSNAKFDTMEIVHDMLPKVRISNIGSVARSCVAIASGDFSCDLFPGVDHGNCDIAASSLIVEEAGGKVTDFYGNIQKYDKAINGAIITNGVSHDEVLEYVKKYVK